MPKCVPHFGKRDIYEFALSTNVSRDQEQRNMYITCMYTTQDIDVYGKMTNLFVNFHCTDFKDRASAI